MEIVEKIIETTHIKNMYDLNDFYIDVADSQGYSLFSTEELIAHEDYYKPSARMLQDIAYFFNNTNLPDKKVSLIMHKSKSGVYSIKNYYYKN